MLRHPCTRHKHQAGYKRQQILLCACNRTYDAKHHLFSKYLPFHQAPVFQLGYLPSSFKLFVFHSHAAFLYTRAQAPSRLQETANTSCTCNYTYDAKHHLFSKYLPFHQLLFQLAYLPSAFKRFVFYSHAAFLVHLCTSTKQVTRDSKYFYVPVTALMMPSITCFKSIYLLHQFLCSNWAICPLKSNFNFSAAWCLISLHVTSTKQVTKTANTLCACNRTYDSKHHLFSKYLPSSSILLFQLAYLPSQVKL